MWLGQYDGLVAWMSARGGAWPRQRGRLGRLSSMSEADAQEHRHAQWVQYQRHRGRACLSGEVEGREGVSRSELLERLEGWAWKGVSWRRSGSCSGFRSRSRECPFREMQAQTGGGLVGATVRRYFSVGEGSGRGRYYAGTVDRYDRRRR